MRHASHQCNDDASERVPHLAIGTSELDRLAIETVDEEHDPATSSQATFVIGTDGIVKDVDAGAAALLGYPREELVGQRFKVAACMRHRNGDEITVELALCSHGGSSIARVTPVASHERAHHNSEVLQIVHDLRSPLATMALEMCLLETKLVQRELQSAVTRVAQNIAFLDRMLQDMLDAGSMDMDSFEVHQRRTELRALVSRVIDRATATRDRTRVFLEAPNEISVNLDDVRIERVVANLLHNALKYAPLSSEVVIRVELRHTMARVSVIDAGPGIRPEDTSIIFDKYQRADSGLGHDGNGLGLYVSKRIVEAHGGRIGVDSVHGVGACFYFELPVAATCSSDPGSALSTDRR